MWISVQKCWIINRLRQLNYKLKPFWGSHVGVFGSFQSGKHVGFAVICYSTGHWSQLFFAASSHLRGRLWLRHLLLDRLLNLLLHLLLSLKVLEKIESLSDLLVQVSHICEKSFKVDDALVKEHTCDLTSELTGGLLNAIIDSVSDELSSLIWISLLSQLGDVNINQLNWSEWCL